MLFVNLTGIMLLELISSFARGREERKKVMEVMKLQETFFILQKLRIILYDCFSITKALPFL